jgi:hypothetical protein
MTKQSVGACGSKTQGGAERIYGWVGPASWLCLVEDGLEERGVFCGIIQKRVRGQQTVFSILENWGGVAIGLE